MLISPEKIAPSQDFLKERTVKFIFSCLRDGNAEDLPPTTEANITRNEELAAKYDSVLDEREKVAAEGIVTFADLIAQYKPLFDEVSAA